MVLANIGHKGIRLIMPAPRGDLRRIHPKAISLITKQLLGESEDKPMTAKQQKMNKKGRRFRIYMVYN